MPGMDSAAKASLQIRVLQRGAPRMFQPIVDARHDIASAIRCIETAVPIGEAALGGAELNKLVLVQIEGPHTIDRRGHFLPIGAHILHRRSADRAGNAREALQAGAVIVDGSLHKLIPILAGCNLVELFCR